MMPALVALMVTVAAAQPPWGPDAPPPAPPPVPSSQTSTTGAGVWGTGTAETLPAVVPSPPAALSRGVTETVLLPPEMADPGDAAVRAGLVVQVNDRAAAVSKVVGAAEASGGWFSELGIFVAPCMMILFLHVDHSAQLAVTMRIMEYTR